ncbi:MAG: hypothetical protein LBP62_05725 [Clostridiales bacterium]|jgi:hypothetical protein|nr:hypothetical protein [Clostridiales bacterium]
MKKVLLFFVLIVSAAFSLSACSPVKYNEELLKDGGFDAFTGGEEGVSSDYWIIDKDRADSSDIQISKMTASGHGNVVRMYSQSSSKEDYNYIYQEVAVKKNSYYKLAIDIYTKKTTAETPKTVTKTGAFIGVLEDDAFVRDAVFQTNGEWVQRREIYFYNKDYTTIRVALRVGTAANPANAGTVEDVDLQFDNASLQMLKKSDVPKVVLDSDALLYRLTKNAKDYSTGFGVFLTVFLCVVSAALSYTLYHFIRRGLRAKDAGEPLTFSRLKPAHLLAIVLGAAFLIRIVLQSFVAGYDEKTSPNYFSELFRLLNDSFFAGWSDVLQTPTGRSQTPGMLLVYGVLSGIRQLFNIEYGAAGNDLLAKIPGIIADLLAAGYIFLYARKTTGEKTAFMFGLAYAVLPAVFLTSAGWGSADSLMGLFLILGFFALLDKKYVMLCVYTTLALVFNQKALYVLPLVAVFLGYIFYRDAEKRGKLIVTAVACVLGFWIISFPFTNFAENPFYVFVQYTVLTKVTEGGALLPVIGYTTLDAFNFYAMINGNFASYTGIQGGFDIVIALSVFAGVIALYFKRKNRADLVLLSAFSITAIFMFTLGMQPYSMVFALALLLLYVLIANEKRVFFILSAFSLTTALNILLVLSADGLIGEALKAKDYTASAASLLNPVWTIIFSVINVLLILYFAYVVYDITYKGNLKNIMPKGDDSGDSFVLAKVKGLFAGKKG